MSTRHFYLFNSSNKTPCAATTPVTFPTFPRSFLSQISRAEYFSAPKPILRQRSLHPHLRIPHIKQRQILLPAIPLRNPRHQSSILPAISAHAHADSSPITSAFVTSDSSPLIHLRQIRPQKQRRPSNRPKRHHRPLLIVCQPRIPLFPIPRHRPQMPQRQHIRIRPVPRLHILLPSSRSSGNCAFKLRDHSFPSPTCPTHHPRSATAAHSPPPAQHSPVPSAPAKDSAPSAAPSSQSPDESSESPRP